MMFKLKLLLFRWSRKLKQFNYWLWAQAVFVLLGFLRLFPAKAAISFSTRVARLIGPLTPRHKVATDNLRKAYPEKSEAEIEKIAREMWDSMARLFAEYIFLDAVFDFDPYAVKPGLVEVEGIPIFERLRDEKKPHIFFTAHTGNFELLPICAATFGLNVTALFRPPNNLYRQQGFEGAPHEYGSSGAIEGRCGMGACGNPRRWRQCRHAGGPEIFARRSLHILQSPGEDQSAARQAGTAI